MYIETWNIRIQRDQQNVHTIDVLSVLGYSYLALVFLLEHDKKSCSRMKRRAKETLAKCKIAILFLRTGDQEYTSSGDR